MGANGQVWLSAKTAAHYYFKAPYLFAIYFTYPGNCPEIMHKYKCGIFFTARDCDFEFPAHLLAIWLAKEIFKYGMSVRRNIKWLLRVYACSI